MKKHVFHALALAAVALCGAVPARAQDEGRARLLLAEAQEHEDEGRYAMAAQRYLELHGVMEAAELPRAPVALWSAGNALSQVPGQEREAVDALRRFLDTSVELEDEQIRQWRATSGALIEELELRAGPGTEADAQSDPGIEADVQPAVVVEPHAVAAESAQHGISPIGPIALAVGAAVLVAGLVVVGVAYAQNQDQASRCPDLASCSPEMRDEADATLALGLAGDVVWLVGAAVAVTGLVLTFVLEGDPDQQPSAELLLRGAPAGAMASLRWRLP